MGARDFTTPDGLLNYALRLVFIFLFNVPLLYGGIARALDFTNAATSITPDIRFGFIGHRGMGTIQIWELASTVRGCDFRLRLPAHAWERPTIVRRQLHRHDGILAVCCPLRADGFLFQTRRCAATLCISPRRSGFVQAGLQEVRHQTRWQRVANCVVSSAPDQAQKSRAVTK
jgi:hypothetical protein